LFTNDLRTALVKKQQCADDILTSLDRGEFGCVYQPQFCASSLKVSGIEVLVRWHHPKRGMLSPIEFLDTAEELGVVSRLDQIVLERALADVAVWEAQGLPVPRISVNVSGRRLRDPALPAWIDHLGERAKNISFELLESIFLDDSDDLLKSNLQAIRDLGISIEVDDFGTGHASIVGLLNLRPDRLKIDRQLILPILGSERQRLLVKSIVEIGKVQGIGVVAEGVETAAHIDVLRDLGCDFLQGYGLCRPVPAAEIQGLLAVAKATGNVYQEQLENPVH
jgi:EAL domain-containing protein (putative c-di-GMP-specific phosphodiesterase class I)